MNETVVKGRPAEGKILGFTVKTWKIWNAAQSWWLEAVVTMFGENVRLHIRRNAYDMQSYAQVERWTGKGWTAFTTLPIADQPVHGISYRTTDRGKVEEVMEQTAERLVADAKSALQV